MAYNQGISDFVRVQGSDQYGVPTQQVYAIGPGGKPITSEQELSKLSGGAFTSGSQTRTITPQEAVSLGIVDFAKAPTNYTQSNSSTIAQNTAQQQIDNLNKQIADYTAQQKSQAEQASQASAGLLGKIGDVLTQRQALPSFDAQASYTNALSQYGFTPTMFTKMNESVTTLDTLNKQLAALDTEEQTRLMNNDQRQAPMDFIEGEGLKIARAYAIKKSGVSAQASAVAATLEALRGNLSQANALASETVKNLAYNYQQKVDDLQWSFDAYSTLYNSMSQKEQNAWKNVYDSAVNELQMKKTDYTNLLNMMIQYPDASWPTDISTLSLADATQIAMQSAAKTKVYENQLNQLKIQQAQADLAHTKAQTANIGNKDSDLDKVLDILDIARLKEQYPNLNFTPGMTLRQAQTLVNSSLQSRNFTDEEIRTLVKEDKSNSAKYEEVISGIDSDSTIMNKDRAKFIAAELYGKAKGKTFDEWMGKSTPTQSLAESSQLIPTGNGFYWTPDGQLIAESEISAWNQKRKQKVEEALFNKR